MLEIIVPDLTITFGRFVFAWGLLAAFYAFAQVLVAWDMMRKNSPK